MSCRVRIMCEDMVHKIHPLDVTYLLNTRPMALLKFRRPWWGWLIPGFSGPFKGTIIIDGVEYEQDVNTPRHSDYV